MPGVSEDALKDLAAFGVGEEQLAQLKTEQKGNEGDRRIEIEPENADAVQLFLRMQTQWRTSAVSGWKRAFLIRTGLEYTVLPAIAGALGITITGETLDGLAVLERETIRIESAQLKTLARMH